MDCIKIGQLIRRLRQEQNLTQLQLAEHMNISDKTVSKWERGLGCPDLCLLPALSTLLGVTAEDLLSGELNANDSVGGNMKKLKFYVCPHCGNILTSTSDADISCCGKKLPALLPQKAADFEKLSVETIENEYFVTANHESTKEHYLTFAALLTGDTLLLRKLYPEWDVQLRLPRLAHGVLVWHCSQHGLFYQTI